MDRSRRAGAKQERPSTEPPASSRLTRRKQNRRRPETLRERMPTRRAMLDACGRALRRAVPALAATAVILGVGSSVWLGYRFVTTSERFAISNIEIQGASQLSDDAIRKVLPVGVGENIFTTDLETVTRALRNDPWIASASAHRVLPDTLVVEIRERVAAAVVQLGNELYVVDESGHPFKRAQLETGEGQHLPVVAGFDRDRYRDAPDETAELIVQALGVLARWRSSPTRPEIGEIRVDAHHAVTLTTYEQATAIQLGPVAAADIDARFAMFDAAWSELDDHERARVSTMHLDARTDHITVAFAPNLKD